VTFFRVWFIEMNIMNKKHNIWNKFADQVDEMFKVWKNNEKEGKKGGKIDKKVDNSFNPSQEDILNTLMSFHEAGAINEKELKEFGEKFGLTEKLSPVIARSQIIHRPVMSSVVVNIPEGVPVVPILNNEDGMVRIVGKDDFVGRIKSPIEVVTDWDNLEEKMEPLELKTVELENINHSEIKFPPMKEFFSSGYGAFDRNDGKRVLILETDNPDEGKFLRDSYFKGEPFKFQGIIWKIKTFEAEQRNAIHKIWIRYSVVLEEVSLKFAQDWFANMDKKADWQSHGLKVEVRPS
jgi:hypothetical protein